MYICVYIYIYRCIIIIIISSSSSSSGGGSSSSISSSNSSSSSSSSTIKICEDLDWINLAHYRDNWRATVNEVMNLRVPQNAGNFLTS